MKKLLSVFALSIVLMSFAGCNSTSTSGLDPNIPKNSKLAEIKMGMNEEQVINILGKPTAISQNQTKNAFIPFAEFFMPDTFETKYNYKNIGTVIFSNPADGGQEVQLVHRVEYH